MKLSKLTIILPTEVPLSTVTKMGFSVSWRARLLQYSKHFKTIEVYSYDTTNFSNILMTKHRPLMFKLGIPYVDHFIYNLYLLVNAIRMSRIVRIYFSSYCILGLLRRLFKKQIVLSYHYFYANTCRTDYNKIKGFFANFLERLSVRAADIVFATTEEIKEYLSKKYGIKSIVLSNPIDRTIFHSSAKKTKSVLYAGRLIRTKGIEYLLEAFKVIRSDYPDYILNIVGGDTEDVRKYRFLASEQNVTSVRFWGRLPQASLASLIRDAVAVVLPTITSEGQPKILLEAMSCGTVCIASDVPGNRGTIRHGFSGILVPPKDHIALAHALKEVIVNKKFRQLLIANALKTVESFDVRTVVKREVDIIKSV